MLAVASINIDTIHEISPPLPIARTSSKWTSSVPTYEFPPWMVYAGARALALTNLEDNWDSYGSTPPRKDVANFSINWLAGVQFEYLPNPFVTPVSGGGIQFEWKVSDRELEIEFTSDEKIKYLKVNKDTPLDEGEINSFNEFTSLFTWLDSESYE